MLEFCIFFFSSRRRHTRCSRDWSSDVCSSDLLLIATAAVFILVMAASAQPTSSEHPGDPQARVIDGVSKDRKSTRLNSSHGYISYAVFCLKKKKKHLRAQSPDQQRQQCRGLPD